MLCATFDKAVLMSKGSNKVAFRYGIDRSRFARSETSNGVSKTTFYVGGNEIVLHHNSNKTDIKRHIAGKVIVTLTDANSI